MAISRIIYTFARDFTIPEEYQQLIAYAHKCAKGNNHTRWYKSEENDPLQAMMLQGIIVLLLEFEDDAAAIAVVDIEDEIATESCCVTLGKRQAKTFALGKILYRAEWLEYILHSARR